MQSIYTHSLGAALLHSDPLKTLRPNPHQMTETAKLQTVSTVTIASTTKSSGFTQTPANQWSESEFILTEVIGTGGEGIVWKGLQVSLDREVAIKLLHHKVGDKSSTNSDQSNSEWNSFYQEALIAAKLEHPNIVPIHEIGLTQDGSPLLAMKLVRGKLWSEVIDTDFSTLTEDNFLQKHLQIFIGMMQAVAFAHAQGIVHRDLKPSQVMLGEFGEVLLIDWGIALLIDEQAHLSHRKRTSNSAVFKLPTIETASNPAGTPALMAPEQTSIESDNISYYTDVYLLGGILYFLLCGSYPHDAQTLEKALEQAKTGNIIPPSDQTQERVIPKELEALALNALQTEPLNRVASVKEMILSIKDYLSGASVKRKSLEHSQKAVELLAKLESENSFISHYEETEKLQKLPQGFLKFEQIISALEQIRQLNSEALQLWGNNPTVHENNDKINVIGAISAVKSGDLSMAHHLLVQLRKNKSRSLVNSLIAQEKQRRKRKDIFRIGSYLLVGIMFFLIVTGIINYNSILTDQNEQLKSQRNSANASKMEAEKRTTEAELARAESFKQEYFSSMSLADVSFQQGNISKVHELLSHQTSPELRHWEWGNLWDRTMGDAMTLILQTGVSENLGGTFSPDGKRIYTSDRRGNLCIWDATTGNMLDSIKLHDDGIWDITVSSDSTKLLTTSFDGTAKYFDINRLEVIHTFVHRDIVLRGGALSPDGKIAVTTERDTTFALWDTTTGERIVDENTLTLRSYDAEFSHNGRYLGVAHKRQGTLHDAKTGKLISMTDVRPENILSISFSPDDKKLVTGCTDRFARVYSVPDLKLLMEIPNVTSWLHSTDWTPDGRYIITSDNNGVARFWSSESGEMVYELNSFERMFHVEVSDDGKHLITVASRGIQVWNIDSLSKFEGIDLIKPKKEDINSIDFSKHAYAIPLENQGTWIGYDRHYRLPSDNGRITFESKDFNFAIDSYYAAFEPNGDRIFRTEFPDFSVVIEDQKTGKKIKNWDLEDVFSARWSPTGEYLAIFNLNGETSLYDGETISKKKIMGNAISLENYNSAKQLGDMAFSQDGSMIVFGRRDGSADVFNTQSGELIQRFETVEDAVYSVAFSPDGSLVAVGYLSNDVHVYETGTGKLKAELIGNQDIVISVSIHPDNKRLISAAQDDRVRLWELEKGREVATVFDLADNRFLLGAGFTPDGRNVFAISSDQTVLIAGSMDWTIEGSNKDIIKQMETFKRQKHLNPNVVLSDVDYDVFH